jgi:hypothetical protein
LHFLPREKPRLALIVSRGKEREDASVYMVATLLSASKHALEKLQRDRRLARSSAGQLRYPVVHVADPNLT